MLFRISRAAEELGVSPEFLRKKIRNGEIPFYRLGRRSLRVDVEEIRDLWHLVSRGKEGKGFCGTAGKPAR
jgi:excisionase family DNA binding protein